MLIQISSRNNHQPGRLPEALVSPKSMVYHSAMNGCDLIDEGLNHGEPSKVAAGQQKVLRAADKIRQFCQNYDQLPADESDPQRLDVLCSSGHGGVFARNPGECMKCMFFAEDYRPQLLVEIVGVISSFPVGEDLPALVF